MIMNYDLIIGNILRNKTGSINSVISKRIRNNYSNIYSYIINRFLDFESYQDSCKRFIYNIWERSKCPICGKLTKFDHHKHNYNTYCSRKCAQQDNKKILKEIYNNKSDEEKNVIISKIIETNNEKYGADWIWQSDNIKEKIKEIRNNITEEKKQKIITKRWATVKNKYGVDNVSQNKDVQSKKEKTFINNYGVSHYWKTKEFIEYRKELNNSIDFKKKLRDTFIKNKKFGTSKGEEEYYQYLCSIYPVVIRQYISEKYPFKCDFYIPDEDLYIEYQGSQYHNKEPYIGTENQLKELERLNELANRSYRHKEGKKSQYDQIIYTWTVLDVKKRQIAKDNNLNYLEIWS